MNDLALADVERRLRRVERQNRVLVVLLCCALDAAMVTHLEEAFGREHEKTYGHRAGPDEPPRPASIPVGIS
jgi:hypothetical protein